MNETDIKDTCCKNTCCADGCCSDGCKTGECSTSCCIDRCCSDLENCWYYRIVFKNGNERQTTYSHLDKIKIK